MYLLCISIEYFDCVLLNKYNYLFYLKLILTVYSFYFLKIHLTLFLPFGFNSLQWFSKLGFLFPHLVVIIERNVILPNLLWWLPDGSKLRPMSWAALHDLLLSFLTQIGTLEELGTIWTIIGFQFLPGLFGSDNVSFIFMQ